MNLPTDGLNANFTGRGAKSQSAVIALLLLVLGLLIVFSIHLARHRIYQVDECQNFYMAKVFARGESAEFFTNASVFLFGPLSWLSRSNLRSDEMFTAARFIFLIIFWLNLVLMAWVAAGRLFSIRTLVALVAAATLAPLWDYGFEIRHDNLIVTGMLVIWWLFRVVKPSWVSYAFIGAIATVALFTAVKTIVYFVPLSLGLLVFRPASIEQPRWKLCISLACGALFSAILVRLSYGTGGAWEQYLSVFRDVSKYSAEGGATGKFSPWATIARLPTEAPLLVALSLSALSTVAAGVARQRRNAFTWKGNLPEALLVCGTFGALIINPTPFPYNLLHFVPYLFLLTFRYVDELWSSVLSGVELRILAAGVLLFVHFLPFGFVTSRHLSKTNAHQSELMRVAENLTDPKSDPVYDGIGMVLTRPSINYNWYLHSLNIGKFRKPGSEVREMLAAKPAVVVISSYRIDWLPGADRKFIEKRYVPLADDFYVLGNVLPPGGGTFEIYHSGRYCVVPLHAATDLDYSKPLEQLTSSTNTSIEETTLDGSKMTNEPITLAVGMHQIETSSNALLAIVWIGPRLNKLPDLPSGNHKTLFMNWY